MNSAVHAWKQFFEQRYPGLRVVGSTTTSGDASAFAVINAVLESTITKDGKRVQVRSFVLHAAAYSEQRTAYSVQRTAYSVQRTAYSVQRVQRTACAAYSVKRTAYSVQRTAYSVQRTAYSVYSVYSVQRVQRTAYSVKRTAYLAAIQSKVS